MLRLGKHNRYMRSVEMAARCFLFHFYIVLFDPAQNFATEDADFFLTVQEQAESQMPLSSLLPISHDLRVAPLVLLDG